LCALLPKSIREAKTIHANSACGVVAGLGVADGDSAMSDPAPVMDIRLEQNGGEGFATASVQ
jgi:hypothetical protein